MSRLDSTIGRAAGLGPDAESRVARMIALAALGIFFAADDQTSVVAVLPKMIEDIGLATDQFYRAAWIINGYILGYVIAMPLMGRISDAFGHGRVFASALGLFVFGSVWVALSPEMSFMGVGDLTMISIARGVQAIGGGAVVPVAMAIVADNVPGERRAYGLGAMAAASEAGGLVGPLWGGTIAELMGWQAVFWINVPMCLPIVYAMWRSSSGTEKRRGVSIDFAGAALLGASLACLTLALTDDPIEPRDLSVTLALYGAAAILFAAFVLRQTKARAPLVRLEFFKRLPLSAGMITQLLAGGVLIVALVNVPLFTNVVLGGSAIDGGLNLMRLSVALPVGALLGGRLAARLGFGWTAVLAMVLTGAGFLGMAQWDNSPGFVELTGPLLVAGFGLGLVIAPVTTAVVNQVDEGERATVSSLLTVTRLIGALVGVALLTTRGLGGFYTEAGQVSLSNPRFEELVRGLQVDAFQETFLATAVVCFLTAVPAALLGRRRQEAGD